MVGDVIAGPKWSGLRELLTAWRGWRDYELIWLPDDDVFADQSTISAMFDLAAALRFDLCQPALHPASYYAHFTTMRNSACHARRTGFVEIMVPCFSRSALERLLPTLALTTTGWGWGLDSLWPHLLAHDNVGILDATPVLHTRPVGQFRDAALGQLVHEESDRILRDHGCCQVHTTFAAIDATLQPVTESAEALTWRLVEGWRYLFDANPAALPWAIEAQRPQSGWRAYPVDGAPSCGTTVARP